MDYIRYKEYSKHEHYNIVFDKFEKTYAVHSKDLEKDTAMIVGFESAAMAISFAENRVVDIARDAEDVK